MKEQLLLLEPFIEQPYFVKPASIMIPIREPRVRSGPR